MIALVAAAAGTILASAPASAAQGAPPSELAAASASARASGQRVEIVSARSQSSQTFANPNGTFTTEVSALTEAGSVSAYDWTQINKTYPFQSYWSVERDSARVGYSDWSSPAVTYRSFFLFSFSGWQGRTVTGATFEVVLDHSASCSSTPVDLWRTANISRGSSVTWSNSSGSSTWQARLSSAMGYANEGVCGQPDMLMRFSNVAASVQTAADGGSQLTLGLRAPNEADHYQWKKFDPTTAKLLVTWTVS